MSDFSSAELHIISQMNKAAKTLPDDFFGVPAVQELACLLAKIEPLLTDDQRATVVACGAMLVHYSKAETLAGIQAAMLLNKVRYGE